ncbi:MAG: phospholipase D-like domain-containing protein [Granulosicoccus sp.]
MSKMTLIVLALISLGLSSCSQLDSMLTNKGVGIPSLDTRVLSQYRSGPVLSVSSGRVLTDNDDAFETKLNLIKQATSTIDLAYFIFSDDYSSSLMARELLDATKRGVHVRMLLDYHSHYKSLDFFRMLEFYGNKGTGRLSVKLYNRPSRNIVKDAVFMTMGCGQKASGSKTRCGEEKFQEIEQLFAEEKINDDQGSKRNISNINKGNSGLFLSGLYAKNPELMAMAVSRGQDIEITKLKSNDGGTNPEDTEKLKELAKLYWLATYGSGMDRLVNRVKLSAAFLFYGEQVNPIFDAFTAFLPVERSKNERISREALQQSRNDWQYLTDFLHHKILFVDQKELVLGGRNVEDSYHMNTNPLSAKYTFMDTDVHLRLTQPQIELTRSYDNLWEFDTMVATLKEVESHAPNDFLVNSTAAKNACESFAKANVTEHQDCLNSKLIEHRKISRKQRYRSIFDQLNVQADYFLAEYLAVPVEKRSPAFNLDTTAQVGYFENLPFDKDLAGKDRSRLYGAVNDSEMVSGKNIHALWLSALKNSCEIATENKPVTVYLHNAYFFLPSNLLSAIAQMTDGRQPCAYVDIVVLSNSIETTDLNVVNVLSRHSMKALFDHYGDRHNPATGATLRYFEYLPIDDDNRSLHSKVMVFGDDIYIGSANADLRSYMMDSNNGIFIRKAPRLLAEYTGWVNTILEDPSRSVNLNNYYFNTERSHILKEGDLLVDAELAKYRAERFIKDTGQIMELKNRLRDASNEVYRLSKEIISDHDGSSSQQASFNRLFKAI